MVSRELEKECVVVFDEAHNIDNVCIEALSVNLRQQTLRAARGNISKLENVRPHARTHKHTHTHIHIHTHRMLLLPLGLSPLHC